MAGASSPLPPSTIPSKKRSLAPTPQPTKSTLKESICGGILEKRRCNGYSALGTTRSGWEKTVKQMKIVVYSLENESHDIRSWRGTEELPLSMVSRWQHQGLLHPGMTD